MRIYKLLREREWKGALQHGVYEGSAVDRVDGFIHLSTASQAAETGRRYFSGVDDLILLQIEADMLGSALKWEPSRGGELFPHLYASLNCGLVSVVRRVSLDGAGAPVLEGLPA